MWKILWALQFFTVLCFGSPTASNVQSFRDGRIVGGTAAVRNQFPYQVAFFIYTGDAQSICGGSILSANFVLSAAHCFIDFEEADLLAGLLNLQNDDPGYELSFKPADVIMHAQYNRTSNLNDIALVSTSRQPIQFNATLQPVPLIPRSWASTDLSNINGRIAGWGRTSDSNPSVSSILLFMDAPIITNLECTRIYGPIITGSNVCLSGSNSRSTCQGDSGGPLTITIGTVQTQVGIVSFGSDKGCQYGYPTVFTRITSFYSWIQAATGITIS